VNFSKRLSIITGVVAAIGVCFKPFFVIIALSPEMYLCIVNRKSRSFFTPEMYSFILIGLIYAFHFLLLPIDIKEAFWERFSFVARGYNVYDMKYHTLLNYPVIFISWPFSIMIRLVVLTSIVVLLPFLINYSQETVCRTNRAAAVMTLSSLITYYYRIKGGVIMQCQLFLGYCLLYPS
jgi:hypothetical protein